MTRTGFLIARTLRREDQLADLSVPQRALIEDLRAQNIALIGNARSLSEGQHGAAIDAADLVIRINLAPQPSPESHGTRTDWLALATRLPDSDRERLTPDRILWMSHKRKRLDYRSATSDGFYLHPLRDYHALEDHLGAQPSTGAMMIDLIARSDMAQLTLYGFDFFASKSLSGRRSAEQVPHDFDAEGQWARQLITRDPRISLTESATKTR